MQLSVRFIVVLLLATYFVTGCANFGMLSDGGKEMAQVPISTNPSGKIYPGKFVWHDLLTPDPVSAAKFYEDLFGWKVEFQDKYAIIRNGDKLIGGILKVDPPSGKSTEGVWIPSVSVADVDATVALVEASGGKVMKGPMDMEKRGRAVLISDSQRADLVLLRATGGDPVDSEAAIGDWLWDEIWTDDIAKTGKFYQSVLGYDDMKSRGEYRIFLNKNKWRAGMRKVRDGVQHMLWVPVVRVEDPSVISRRAEELGGKIWVSPEDAPGNGGTALIADTTGAILLIQQWPQPLLEGGQ